MDNEYTNRMTFQLLRHFYHMKRQDELMQTRSVNDIKKMLLHYWWGLTVPDESFLKGVRFYDFDALYDYVCSKRTIDAGLYLRMAIADLKVIPTVRSQIPV